MRTETRTLFIAIAIATGLFVTGAAAQHEGHNNQTSPQADNSDSAKTGDMPGMHRMMMGQNEASKLVDQLAKSFAAIEAEKDPAALREKLAEHGKLLKELESTIDAQSRRMESHRMEMMHHMMSGGSAMGGDSKK
ncbi:MAG: hypothetical protein ABSG41_25435 [Bryobacteraceae bacterium]|jgi:hypothetical protein